MKQSFPCAPPYQPRRREVKVGGSAAPERGRPARKFLTCSRRREEADRITGGRLRFLTSAATRFMALMRVPQASRLRVLGASRPESVRAARRGPNSQARTPALPAHSDPWPRRVRSRGGRDSPRAAWRGASVLSAPLGHRHPLGGLAGEPPALLPRSGRSPTTAGGTASARTPFPLAACRRAQV